MNVNSKPRAPATATKVLVTGWSGTGKSTVCRELIRRSLNAIDADTVKLPFLCEWVNTYTGEWLGRGFPEDYSNEKYDFCWRAEVIKSILEVNSVVYLCGNADNAFDFYNHFDYIFILDLPEAEQRRRIMSRVEHNYGQDKATQDAVIQQQKKLVSEAIKRGAIHVDANRPVAVIADDILKKAGN